MSLQIHITAGSRKGQRLLAGSTPLSFGRDADNALVIDLAQISRKHGELIPKPDGTWLLVNHSPNGTELNGKTISTKPCVLLGEMSVGVGKLEILRVVASSPASSAALALPAAETTSRRPPSSKRSRITLWAGIVVGVSSLLILFLLVAPMFSDSKKAAEETPTLREWSFWTEAQIIATVESPIRETYQPDLAHHESAMRIAHSAYTPGRPMHKGAWLDAYRTYREAARHHQGAFQDPGDAHDYRAIVGEVAKIVTQDYREACLEFNRRSYHTASPLFGKMLGYAGGTDPLLGKEFRDHLLKLKSLAVVRQKQ